MDLEVGGGTKGGAGPCHITQCCRDLVVWVASKSIICVVAWNSSGLCDVWLLFAGLRLCGVCGSAVLAGFEGSVQGLRALRGLRVCGVGGVCGAWFVGTAGSAGSTWLAVFAGCAGGVC